MTLRVIARAPRLARVIYVLCQLAMGAAAGLLLFGGIITLAVPNGGPFLPGELVAVAIVIACLLVYAALFRFVWTVTGVASIDLRRERLRYLERVHSVPQAIYDSRVHGVPGSGLVDTIAKNGLARVEVGHLGEQITASLLDELLVIPSVHIIHGLRFPGAHSADIDHVVVAGNRIALIDSKLWKPGQYELDTYNRILESGVMDATRGTHHSTAVTRMATIMTDCEVRGWIVVHPVDDRPFSARTADPAATTRLVTADDLLREVGDWLVGTGGWTSLFVVRDLIAQRNW